MLPLAATGIVAAAASRLEGDGAKWIFGVGCIGLATTRIGTRWMDRVDVRSSDVARSGIG